MTSKVLTVVSGGQTGADRAALDWAIANGIAHGGWCPAGRTAEDGPLPSKYQLCETSSGGYRQRTRCNVEDSDGTLILNLGLLEGGSLATQRFTEKAGRPLLVLQLDEVDVVEAARRVSQWIEANRIARLNVAGPRESKRPGIYQATFQILESLHAPRNLNTESLA